MVIYLLRIFRSAVMGRLHELLDWYICVSYHLYSFRQRVLPRNPIPHLHLDRDCSISRPHHNHSCHCRNCHQKCYNCCERKHQRGPADFQLNQHQHQQQWADTQCIEDKMTLFIIRDINTLFQLCDGTYTKQMLLLYWDIVNASDHDSQVRS